MKRKLVLSLSMVFISITFSFSNPCYANAKKIGIDTTTNGDVIIAQNQKNLSNNDLSVIKQNINDILSTKYEIMKNGKLNRNKNYIDNPKLLRFEENNNKFLEEWYKKVNLSISDYSSNLTINKIKPLLENKYIVEITYDIDIILKGRSNKSRSYGENYKFELQNKNGTWYVTKMLNVQEDLGNNTKNSLVKTNDFQDYDNLLNSKIKSLNSTYQNIDDFAKKYNFEKNKTLTKSSSYLGYNAETSVNYAKLWANGRNPDYTDYHSNDCANFVSQCIYAGGIPTSSQWKPDSVAWINVIKFYDYMLGKTYISSNISSDNAKKGDIIEFYENNSSTWSHAAILTGYDSSGWLYSGHSNNRLNWPLAAVYPSSTYTNLRYLKF